MVVVAGLEVVQASLADAVLATMAFFAPNQALKRGPDRIAKKALRKALSFIKTLRLQFAHYFFLVQRQLVEATQV